MGMRRETWLTTVYGGVPGWGLVAGGVAFVGMAVFALTNMSNADAAAAPDVRPSYSAPATVAATPTASADRPTVLFLGDSYTAGAGASEQNLRWTSVASKSLAWKENNEGLGGTGYVTSSDSRGCGLDYCNTYPEQVASLTKAQPDMVVISGGRNDNNPGSGYYDAVLSTIESVKDQWPTARVLVTSPLWDDDDAPRWFSASVDAVRDAAAEAQVSYLDLGQPLLGHQEFITDDGIHPTDAGYAAIASEFVQAYQAAT